MKPQQNTLWMVLIHVLFWVLLMATINNVYYRILGDSRIARASTIINSIGLAGLIYGHLLYLIPRFFLLKRYVHYAIGLIVLLLLSTAFRFYVGWEWVKISGWQGSDNFTPSFFVSLTIGGIIFLLLSLPLRLITNWFKKNELEQALKSHQLEAELRFLKAQVNPHFLFNALNNIYSLSFTESSKTPEMILKLSDMMSYMLYDCKNDLVSLDKEVDYLKNYISLQQLKKDGELQVEFDVRGPLNNVQVVPMLFIPFFENAFKHGNLDDLENGWLSSELHYEHPHLTFKIRNSLNPMGQSKSPKGGVGLENIRQRLHLIFPDRHQLTIQSHATEYSVDLQINMKTDDL